MIIRGQKHTFGDVVKSYSFDDFKKHCEGLKIFAQLPTKERNFKIKEAYGEHPRNVKPSKKLKSRPDLCINDVESNRGDSGAESRSDDGGQNLGGNKDKAEVQEQRVRKPKKEKES